MNARDDADAIGPGAVYDPDRAPAAPPKPRDPAAEAELRQALAELHKPSPLADAPSPTTLTPNADGSLVAAGAEAAAAYVAEVSPKQLREHRTIERAKIVVGAKDPSRRAVTMQVERPPPPPPPPPQPQPQPPPSVLSGVDVPASAAPKRGILVLAALGAAGSLIAGLVWLQRAPLAPSVQPSAAASSAESAPANVTSASIASAAPTAAPTASASAAVPAATAPETATAPEPPLPASAAPEPPAVEPSASAAARPPRVRPHTGPVPSGVTRPQFVE